MSNRITIYIHKGLSEYPFDESGLYLFCIEDGTLTLGGKHLTTAEPLLKSPLKVGDFLKFCLDQNQHTLSLSINSCPYVSLFSKLPDASFTPAVAFSGGMSDTVIKGQFIPLAFLELYIHFYLY